MRYILALLFLSSCAPNFHIRIDPYSQRCPDSLCAKKWLITTWRGGNEQQAQLQCIYADTCHICDDNNHCTYDTVDASGYCLHIQNICNDNNLCTVDTCEILTGNCLHTQKICNDDNACTGNTCVKATGVCVFTNYCVSNDPCYSASCTDSIRGHCTFYPLINCDDNSVCTIDTCSGGTCHHTSACDDHNVCTQDWCVGGGCTHVIINCNDNNRCTADICDTVRGCINTNISTICIDGDACTSDWCDPVTKCNHRYETSLCTDASPCTVDTCIGANNFIQCVHTVKDCNDYNACTQDGCNSQFGQCTHVPVLCDDGNDCTRDVCYNIESPMPYCYHTDTCCHDTISDPIYADPNTGQPSFCKLIVCGVNMPRSCDDGEPCTNDYCLEISRVCMNSPVNCDDGTGVPYCCIAGYCNYGSICTGSNKWEEEFEGQFKYYDLYGREVTPVMPGIYFKVLGRSIRKIIWL